LYGNILLVLVIARGVMVYVNVLNNLGMSKLLLLCVIVFSSCYVKRGLPCPCMHCYKDVNVTQVASMPCNKIQWYSVRDKIIAAGIDYLVCGDFDVYDRIYIEYAAGKKLRVYNYYNKRPPISPNHYKKWDKKTFLKHCNIYDPDSLSLIKNHNSWKK